MCYKGNKSISFGVMKKKLSFSFQSLSFSSSREMGNIRECKELRLQKRVSLPTFSKTFWYKLQMFVLKTCKSLILLYLAIS